MLTHSLTLPLTFLLGFPWILAQVWLQENSLSYFFAVRLSTHLEEQHSGKNIHIHLTNVTRIELFSFILVRSCCKHEGCRSEDIRSYQEDDKVRLVSFTGWVKLLSFPQIYTNTDHDGLWTRWTIWGANCITASRGHRNRWRWCTVPRLAWRPRASSLSHDQESKLWSYQSLRSGPSRKKTGMDIDFV